MQISDSSVEQIRRSNVAPCLSPSGIVNKGVRSKIVCINKEQSSLELLQPVQFVDFVATVSAPFPDLVPCGMYTWMLLF